MNVRHKQPCIPSQFRPHFVGKCILGCASGPLTSRVGPERENAGHRIQSHPGVLPAKSLHYVYGEPNNITIAAAENSSIRAVSLPGLGTSPAPSSPWQTPHLYASGPAPWAWSLLTPHEGFQRTPGRPNPFTGSGFPVLPLLTTFLATLYPLPSVVVSTWVGVCRICRGLGKR